ncbi:MAG TPA: phage terminase large subunit family protein [Pyrinomonadaceae bacterium]|jgi:phage terminase large subunit GpA-like protein
MTSEAIIRVFSDAIAIAIPESSLTVSQWAATYRFLSAERSARPGRWRNELVPYLVEIMDTVGKPGVREIIFVKSSQVAGTECANNIIGYFMHIDPSPILYSCETEPKADAWSKESLAPMIRDTPVLASIVSDARSRDSGNTIGDKSFPGGHLAIGYATSAATASSRPRRIVINDERDAYRPTSEGDYCKLAEKRTTTFPDAIIFKPSTPRDRLENPPGSPPEAPRFSPIELEYENSDKRRYYVPCPHCDEYQALVWKRDGDFTIKWDDDDVLNAYYVCVNGCVIEHEHKTEMLARGEWRAEKPFTGRAGFHIWEGYSPFVTWGEMAKNFLEAKQSKETLKVFVNTSLAEGWEDLSAQASVEDLESRREPYGELLPDGVLVLTAGVDVQGNRLEVEIVGWGIDDESWSIDHQVLMGDPSQNEVWQELKDLLLRDYEFEIPIADGNEDGDGEAALVQTIRVACACIDTGGHNTEDVYRFARKHAGRRWYAVKGANTPGKPLISTPSLVGKPKVRLYNLGTETAKDTIAAHLLVAEPGPGYCHFPTEFERDGFVYYGEKYFKQLRSEHPVVRHERSKSVRRWEKLRPGVRNEALDLRVYAMAAKRILNPDFRRLRKRRESHVAAAIPVSSPPEAQIQAENEEEQAQQTARRKPRARRRRGFVNSW